MPPAKKRPGGVRRRGASSSIDTRRLAKNLAFPGIDPRIWVSVAIVLSEQPKYDAEEGVFVDVLLLPSEVQETARLSAIYAGPLFGLYAPVEKDDEVMVFAPSGDPNEGLVILPRMWSPSDQPPAEIGAHPKDLVMVMKTDQNVRIVTKGEGKVILGNDNATKSVARVDDTTTNGSLSFSCAATVPPAPPGVIITLTWTPPGGGVPNIQTVTLTGAVTGVAVGTAAGLSGKIDSGAERVKA